MTDFLLLLVLILISGVLAASELALVSVRKARIQARAAEGDRRADTVLAITANSDRLLATVQIGITLIAIVSGALGGAALVDPVAALLARVPWIGSSANALAGLVVVSMITYLSLIFGELVPKRLALMNPESIALVVARPMRLVARVTAPVVSFLAFSSNVVLGLLGAKESGEPPVSEEEVELLLQEGARHGVFEETERALVQGVFDLGDRRASELMIPRRQIVALDLAANDEQNRAKILDSPHSSFPVYEGNLDHVVGIVSLKKLWGQEEAGKPLDLAGAMVEPLFVPESAPVFRVLEMFKKQQTRFALVLDEYGGLSGMLTIEDLLEDLASDLDSGAAPESERARRRADGSWLLDAGLPAHEVRELLDIDELPGEENGDFETLAGFMLAELQRIPVGGDEVILENWRFEIVDMDGNRIDQVMAIPTPAAEPVEPS